MPSSIPTSQSSMTLRIGPSVLWKSIGAGANPASRTGWVMAAFDYRQAEDLRDALALHQVRYLFIGKSGAIILGFPDTTPDADLFVERGLENGRRLTAALRSLGFDLTKQQNKEIERG